MPKASPLQPSFTAGEFSPKLYGRTDSERYKTGLATCLNYLPTIEGPIVRRPGTKYSGFDVKDPAVPPILVPFQISKDVGYILEFGANYVRFFKDGSRAVVSQSSYVTSFALWKEPDYFNTSQPIEENLAQTYGIRVDNVIDRDEVVFSGSAVGAGSLLEFSTPFNSSDIRSLNYAIVGNTMYLACGRLPIFKLTYVTNENWKLKPVLPIDGPYLPFNSHTNVGDSSAVTLTPQGADFKGTTTLKTGPRATITAIGPTGSWGTNSTYITVSMSTAGAHSFFVGQRVCIPDEGLANTGGLFGVFSVDAVGSSTLTIRKPVESGFLSGSYVGSGFIYPALFGENDLFRLVSFSKSGKRYWGRIIANSGIISTYNANFVPFGTLPDANPVTTWQLGTWRFNDWPKYLTFHQNRLFASGSAWRPNEVCASVVGDTENFQTSNSSYVVSDAYGLQFSLSAIEKVFVQWLASDSNGLLVGAFNSEWKVSPSSQATALTPTNINASETSYFGSENIPAVKTGNAILYVQRSARKIRELSYFFQFNSYKSTDLTQLSDHITAPSVVGLANQKETIPAVWALRSDGQLLSMVYGRDDETLKAGWARHELGGQSDSGGSPPKVLSMAVIAGSAAQFDQLWMCTRRFVNGTSAVHIEYMTKPFQDDTLLEDAIFLDCAGTYDNPKAITNISIAGSSIVTCPSHGFSDGDQVQITKVVGLNTSVVDINGYEFNSNRVNYGIFRVASTAANSFFLTDVNNGSSYIDTRGYSVYVSGGEARKLVSTIVGAAWLTGETVGVLADGRVHPDAVVGSGGVISLSYAAAKVHVGLKYNSDGKTLRLDAGAGDGTSIGKLRRPSRVAFQLYNVGEISVGMSFTNLVPLSDVESFKADNSSSDSKIPLFNGIARESLESQHDYDGQICFRQSAPLPGMIQSITQMIEENDV